MNEAKRDAAGNIHLPARTIPLPQSISVQAQEALTSPKLVLPSQWPELDDISGWKEVVAELDGHIASLFEALPAFPGKTEVRTVGQADVFELVPDGISAERQDRAIVYLHGGGFVMGGGELALKAAQIFATISQTRVYVVDYRMPPEHPFPAALDDIVALYRDLLTRHAPGKIAFMGVSAGGNLVAAGILKVRDLGLPLPGAAIMLTPATDLTEQGDTFETNKDIDGVLTQRTPRLLSLYAGGHDLRDPYLSPIFGDLSAGFPPTLLISGTRDLLLSSTVMFHRALRRAGIEADLHVFEGMPHGGFGGAPEDGEALMEQHSFIDRILGRH